MRTEGQKWRLEHPEWAHECCRYTCEDRHKENGRDVCRGTREECEYFVPAEYQTPPGEMALRERIQSVVLSCEPRALGWENGCNVVFVGGEPASGTIDPGVDPNPRGYWRSAARIIAERLVEELIDEWKGGET